MLWHNNALAEIKITNVENGYILEWERRGADNEETDKGMMIISSLQELTKIVERILTYK